jgi:hypothetical protein
LSAENLFRFRKPDRQSFGKEPAVAYSMRRPERYDPWYAKAAFGVFLCGLAGSLVALYSGASILGFALQ